MAAPSPNDSEEEEALSIDAPSPVSSPGYDAPSSPATLLSSSPLHSSPLQGAQLLSSSSPASSEDHDQRKRMRYEFFEPKDLDSAKYWPASTSSQDYSSSFKQGSPEHLDDIDKHPQFNVDENQDHQTSPAGLPTCDEMQDAIHGGEALPSTDSSEAAEIGLSDGSNERSVHSDFSSQDEDLESVASTIGCETSDEGSDDESRKTDSGDETAQIADTIYQGSSLSIDEGVLTLMNLFIKYKIPKTEMGGILKSTLKFMPKINNMPKSSHLLFQHVENQCRMSKETTHFYCSICLYYLGLDEKQCPICDNNICHKFYQLPLADQIINLFENHGLADVIDKYQDKILSNPNNGKYICDISDGSEFKRASVHGEYNLTLLGHTDGISVSESSVTSLWPIEYVICQVPPHLRFKYVLVSGVWLDECKPNINAYFKPFVPELKDLSEQGVKWIHPTSTVSHKSIVTCPSFTADAPARAALQNILSHGGKYSCNICEQKTKRLPQEPVLPGGKKKPRKRVYQFQEIPSIIRTADRMEKQGRESRKQSERGGKLVAQKGVKGPSIISELPGCDRSTVVFPEYMHLLMVVTKHFFTLWFKENGPWSLKYHRDTINASLTSIRVPDFLTRIPRSTEHFPKWKANELRSFVLYFSVIVLSKCMGPEHFQHWMLFVNGLYLLLQDEISEKNVKRADILLKMFCRDFSKLYKPQYYTYYIHNILHLSLTVSRHGNLWSNSAFQFESFNGTLAKYIHGTKNQGKELVNNVRLAIGVEVLKARLLISKPQSSVECHAELKNEVKIAHVTKEATSLLSSSKIELPMRVYFRAVRSNEVFTTSTYRRQKKRNNFTICYLDETNSSKEYGEIQYFCESASNQQLAIIKKFKVELNRLFSHAATGITIKHIIPIKETNDMVIISLDKIIHKVIRVEDFVCLRPNTFEVNL